ncbi:MAG: hypothetical protein ACKOF7_01335, partial [Phycisphaerales bacterium]
RSDSVGGYRPPAGPPGSGRPAAVGALARARAARGMGTRDVAAFAHGNWMRVLRAALDGGGGAGTR